MNWSLRTGRLVALGALLAASPLLAATPGDTITTRVAGLRELGAAMKSVRDALQDPAPQTILIQMSARQIMSASRDIYGWFPAGSGPGTGLKTAAKAEIWTNPAGFKKAQDSFAAEAKLFQGVAAGGNIEAIRAETAKLGSTCKGCHDQFRTETH